MDKQATPPPNPRQTDSAPARPKLDPALGDHVAEKASEKERFIHDKTTVKK